MHFEALLVLAGFASFFSGLACFREAGLGAEDFAAALKVQFLLVQWPSMMMEPQVQNSAKYITPFYTI
jgi:hypothetical protein